MSHMKRLSNIKTKGDGTMVTLLTITAVSAKVAISNFTAGALLGATLYTASRTNKVTKRRKVAQKKDKTARREKK